MSILWWLQARKNPQDRALPAKYYMQAVKRGSINFEELLVRASNDTTLDPDELRMSVNRAFFMAETYLGDGFTVNFGRLGYMMTSILSEGVDMPAQAGAHNMKRIRIHFIFGKAIRDFMQKVGLEMYRE